MSEQHGPTAGGIRLPPIYAMMLVILGFGTTLAVGSIRAFGIERGWLHATIILACSLAFLGCWGIVLRRRGLPHPSEGHPVASKKDVPRTELADTEPVSSWAGIASAVLAGFVCAGLTWIRSGAISFTPLQVGQSVFLGLILTGIALVLAMVAASDPVPRRGRGLGLLTFVLVLVNGALMGALITIPL